LKRDDWAGVDSSDSRSIHPQGWVPIETVRTRDAGTSIADSVAFTPKGGCPLKLHRDDNLD